MLLFAVAISEKQPVVKTPLGALSGYFMKTRDGRQISAFTSIPFAAPPVGDLRFKVILHLIIDGRDTNGTIISNVGYMN